MRLDVAIVERGLAKSRTLARQIIQEGGVLVNGIQITKPSFAVNTDAYITATVCDWVGRGGKKLDYFLNTINICINGKNCLDIGASTGGFTQALLKKGAKSVTALDVGHSQLDSLLKNDTRVINIEGKDIRDFASEPFEIVVCDLSFISLDKILHDIIRLSIKDIIVLFKPQFEVGRLAKRNKKGVVIDEEAITASIQHFEQTVHSKNLKIIYGENCIISGKEGNIERFYYLSK